MERKYAVALLKGDEEKILGLFDTKAEADAFGWDHRVSEAEGLEYCFSAMFFDGAPVGDQSIYDFYNKVLPC